MLSDRPHTPKIEENRLPIFLRVHVKTAMPHSGETSGKQTNCANPTAPAPSPDQILGHPWESKCA